MVMVDFPDVAQLNLVELMLLEFPEVDLEFMLQFFEFVFPFIFCELLFTLVLLLLLLFALLLFVLLLFVEPAAFLICGFLRLGLYL